MASYPVASGQTFVAGDFVTLNSSGQLILIAVDSVNTGAAAGTYTFSKTTASALGSAAGYTGNMILGQAMAPALDSTLGTIQAYVPVALALEDVEFCIPGYAASINVTPGTTVANTLIGQSFGAVKTATGFPALWLDFYVNATVSGANVAPIAGYPVASAASNIFFRITDLYAGPNDYASWPSSGTDYVVNYGNVWAVVIAPNSLVTGAR